MEHKDIEHCGEEELRERIGKLAKYVLPGRRDGWFASEHTPVIAWKATRGPGQTTEQRPDYDGCSLSIGTTVGAEVALHTWLESHHNGDHYANQKHVADTELRMKVLRELVLLLHRSANQKMRGEMADQRKKDAQRAEEEAADAALRKKGVL